MTGKKRFLSVILALALAAAALGPGPAQEGESAQAVVTQAEINALKDQLKGIGSEIKTLEDQLKNIAGDKAKAVQEKEYLDSQIALVDQQIAQLDTIIANYDQLIAQRQAEVEELETREENQYELFCRRVRSMEEQGAVSYLSILFNASSFSELLDNAMLVGEIMDYDNGVIEMLQNTRRSVEEAKAELEQERAEQSELRMEQEAARVVLQEKEEQAAELVRRIESQEDEYEAALKELEAEEAKVEKEMKDAQKAFEEAQRAAAVPVVSESGFLWPLTGRYRLTSKFGWRSDPFTGKQSYHNGTDIPAPKGTPILAAKTGVVTTSKSHSSYGNYVVVTHSDGYQTLYAHMSSRAVSVGDIVKQGQVLGYVGSTGRSTAPHLHYEVWYGGSRTNAEDYYPNLPFDRAYLR